MLYDPKWEQKTETKADPFDLATLIAWLERQPTDAAYNYECNGSCLLAIYFQHQGFPEVAVFPWTIRLTRASKEVELPRPFNAIAQGGALGTKAERWTFGAALERARSFSR